MRKFNTNTRNQPEYFTPKWVYEPLGAFDLDPCTHPTGHPRIAPRWFSVCENGLAQPWVGRVWLNPPYGNQTGKWLKRMAAHGNGIVLIFARTETRNFQEFVFNAADAILFVKSRIPFENIDRVSYGNNGGAPSCLIAYGGDNVKALERSGIQGKLVYLRG